MMVQRTKSSASSPTSRNEPSSRESLSTVSSSILTDKDCGINTTETIFVMPDREKMYWHKGKGFLVSIDMKNSKESEFHDVITSISRPANQSRERLHPKDGSNFERRDPGCPRSRLHHLQHVQPEEAGAVQGHRVQERPR